MLFTSLHWAVFLLVTFGLYHVVPAAYRRWLMFVASIYFYASWSVPYLSLIGAQIFVDWMCGYLLHRTEKISARKALVAISVVFNLSALCFFKYYGLFSNTLGAFGVGLPALHLVLPLAISFYSFESMSYTIDVYRRELEPVRSPVHLALFITWFPHLIAGPIIRPSEFIPQLDRVQPVTKERFFGGLNLMLIGYAKKLLGADWLANVVDPIFASPATHTSAELLVGVYAYAFQIYFDFSAYTDIARGASRWFGIELPENFRAPYFAVSITDFWRRWHMTLSHWLRDYLYIPLGGNRGGSVRTYVNLILTMLLGGLWHGASWTFLVWGGLHGVYLAVERAFGVGTDRPTGWRLVARRLLTFHLVCVAWVLFRAPTFHTAMQIFQGIAQGRFWLTSPRVFPVVGALALLATYAVAAPFRRQILTLSLHGQRPVRYAIAVGIFFFLLMVLGASSNAFIYFQF